MSEEKTKTDSIYIISCNVADLKRAQIDNEKRIRDVEISQSQTVVHCKNILEKIDEMVDSTKEYQKDAQEHRRETRSELHEIKEKISTQEEFKNQSVGGWKTILTIISIAGTIIGILAYFLSNKP